LVKDKTKRLGYDKDGEDVLSHPFFADIDIEKLCNKEIEAPFKPDVSSDHLDVKFFNAKNDAKDLAETFIPEVKSKKVEKNKD
jgi:serum/glucocorticoid-regulated kinase 2